MGILDNIRGRQAKNENGNGNTNRLTISAPVTDTATMNGEAFKNKEVVGDAEATGSDSDNLSIEARNEKEVQQNPDEVTAGAQRGVQKAEAAALVWDKKAIYCIYSWFVFIFIICTFKS